MTFSNNSEKTVPNCPGIHNRKQSHQEVIPGGIGKIAISHLLHSSR